VGRLNFRFDLVESHKFHFTSKGRWGKECEKAIKKTPMKKAASAPLSDVPGLVIIAGDISPMDVISAWRPSSTTPLFGCKFPISIVKRQLRIRTIHKRKLIEFDNDLAQHIWAPPPK